MMVWWYGELQREPGQGTSTELQRGGETLIHHGKGISSQSLCALCVLCACASACHLLSYAQDNLWVVTVHLTKKDLPEMASKLNTNETTSIMIIDKHHLDTGFMNEKAISF